MPDSLRPSKPATEEEKYLYPRSLLDAAASSQSESDSEDEDMTPACIVS
jgi:hypothetical protein